MSDKNQEFWKELMGEDFKVDLGQGGAPEKPAPEPEPPKGAPQTGDEPFIDGSGGPVDQGFTIEYISRDSAPAEDSRIQRPISPGRESAVPRPVEPTRQTPGIQRPIGPETGNRQTPGQTPGIQRPIRPETGGRQAPGQTPPQRTAQPAPQRPVQPTPQRPVQPTQRRPAEQGGAPGRSGQAPVASRSGSGGAGPAPVQPSGRGGRRKRGDDDFEVEFDFDSEYADVDEKAIRRGRTKRTGCLSGVLMFLFVVCVSAILASVGWIWATDVLGLDGDDEPVEVTLPEEFFHTEERSEEDDDGNEVTREVSVADMDKVAEELYQKGLVKYKWLFKLFSSLSHADEKLKAGTYTLNMVYDYRALVHGMTGTRTTREATTVTVPEGYSITQIVELLVDSGVCQRQELLDTLKDYDFDYEFLKDTDVPAVGDPKRLEGFLFPDTYEFYVGDDPVNVIRKFLNNFQLKWTEEFSALAQERGYTRRQILEIASMIEKEAGNDDERDLISSVIYNRLSHPDRQGTNGLLQIDATIYYVIADTGEEFSTEIDSPYNTYLHPGLPAGPIANPGIASIRAALQPRDTKYYFYALETGKSHKFFESYNDFTAFVNSDEYGGSR